MNKEENKKTIVEVDNRATVDMNNTQSSSSKSYSPLISGALDEQVVSIKYTNAEYLFDKNITEIKSVKSDKPNTDEIYSSEGTIIKLTDLNIEESFIRTLSEEPSELELEFSKSSNFEYNNKVLKQRLKESIAGLVKNLGQGQCGPVPYDTAWVARVPQIDDKSIPAFPLSLQWLRNHQLEDGSWGSGKPFSAHSSTLSTLAAIISLAQWNNFEDKVRIKNGVNALWQLAELLSLEQHENAGFELIIYTLLKEARKYRLSVPYKHYECYKQRSDRKLKLILSEFEKYGYNKPATWWFNLEILGDEMQINIGNIELGFSSNMLTKDGSVGLSPSATAFLLMSHRLKGIDIPEAENYLRHLYSLYAGGIPSVFPIDVYELAFSLDFLLKSSLQIRHPLLKSAIRRLAESWNPKYGVGYSANWELFDADDTAVALYILLKAGYKLSPEPILTFFNGTNIATYLGEATSSISVNINALNTLRLFNGVKEIDEVIQKILIWIDECLLDEQVFIDDKWNVSPYYSTSRAVFALYDLRNDIVKRCLNFFIRNQNSDGGWGKEGFSSVEETAYASLALCYGFKCGYPIPETILKTASIFLFKSHKLNMPHLWLSKVQYHPILITESAIISAQFALIKALKLVKVRSILETIRPHYVVVNVKTTNNEKNFDIALLCSAPEFDISEYSEQIIRIQECITDRLVELNLIKMSKTPLSALIPEFTFYTLKKEYCDEDMLLHSYFASSILIFDRILDEYTNKFDKNDINIISQTFQTLLEILQGKYESVDAIIPSGFPNFFPLCRFFFDLRELLVKRQLDLRDLLFRYEKVLSYYIKHANNVISGVGLSSRSFLEMKKFTGFCYLLHSLHCLVENVSFFSFKDFVIFQKFEDCAMKASHLIQDIISFQHDKDEGSVYDNYVLIKQIECNCSIEDAVKTTANLLNKQIIKMFSLKETLQRDPMHKNNQELWKAIATIENSLQGTMCWSLRCRKNYSETIISISRKQLTEVNLPLILQLLENKAKDTIGQNLKLGCSA